MVTVSSTTRQRVAGLDRTLDPALKAVLLALAADEEPDQALSGGNRYRRAGEWDRCHHRAADRNGACLGGGGGDQLSGGEEARRTQQCPARVDVVLGRRPAGERHLAEHQRVLLELGEQSALGGVEVGHASPG